MHDQAQHGGEVIAPGVSVPDGVVRVSYARSSGPGGQNVNKVSSKAELRVFLSDLPISDRARARLAALCGRRVTDAGELIIEAEEHRSQVRNREAAFDRLRELLVRALAEPKVRRKSRPTRGSIERRLEAKRTRSDVKKRRGRASDE